MSDNFSIDSFSPLFSNSRSATECPMRRPSPTSDAQGGVAVTRFSGALRRIVEQSSKRQARLRAIQADIEYGIYETPERISGTVDRLLDVIA